MAMRLAVILLLMLSIPHVSSADPLDGKLLESTPVALPSYDQALEMSRIQRYADREEYETAATASEFALDKIWYSSDGLRVSAYAYYRKGATGLPTIVFNRGSYVREEMAQELLAMFHRLANRGFAVIAPLYRQSAGGEGKDELGGADVADLMNVVSLVEQLPFVDSDRLFLYGESRGGMMVYQALRDGFPARAAATFGAFTDFEEMTASEEGASMARAIWNDFDERRNEIIARRSVIDWPETIRSPLLLMHGSGDGTVNPTQALRLAIELQRLEKQYGLIIFEGDNHVLSGNRIRRDEEAARWFSQHAELAGDN